MDADRLRLAEEFLREAVYDARGAQAALGSLRAAGPQPGRTCGLGDEASAVLDLAPRARAILQRLLEGSGPAPELARIRSVTSEWVERQDAIDRKRNHFLKEFRARHGLDRTNYGPEILAGFESGLARVNAEEDAARRAFAERLIAPSDSGR